MSASTKQPIGSILRNKMHSLNSCLDMVSQIRAIAGGDPAIKIACQNLQGLLFVQLKNVEANYENSKSDPFYGFS